MSEFPVVFDEKLVGEYLAEAKSAGELAALCGRGFR
jgi:hypothetical protein